MEGLLLLMAYFGLLSVASSLVITRLLPRFGNSLEKVDAEMREKAEKPEELPPPVQGTRYNGGPLKAFGIGALYSVSLFVFVIALVTGGVIVEGAGFLMGMLYNVLIMVFSGAFLVALSKIAPKTFSIGSSGFAWGGGALLFLVFYFITMLFGVLLMGLGVMPTPGG